MIYSGTLSALPFFAGSGTKIPDPGRSSGSESTTLVGSLRKFEFDLSSACFVYLSYRVLPYSHLIFDF